MPERTPFHDPPRAGLEMPRQSLERSAQRRHGARARRALRKFRRLLVDWVAR